MNAVGPDATATGPGDALRGAGEHVLVVRPASVRTRMTAHLPAAPLSTVPRAVRGTVATGIGSRAGTDLAPSVLRPVMGALRYPPRAASRRFPS